MKKVLLVSMPFGALERPALGLSLLKATLAREAVPCDVRYLTFPFAELVGYDEYQWLQSSLPYTAFAGDWAFTAALYGDRPTVDQGYVQEVLRLTWRLGEDDIGRILRVRSLTTYYLDYCMALVPWAEYAVVGFTSTFEQNIASLALARQIRSAYPEIAIVFGGANWEGDMGLELHRQFPFVDYVCSGEAEESFPALVRSLFSGQPVEEIRGIVYRTDSGSVATGPAPLLRNLDELAVPDFDDYFAGLEQSTGGSAVVPTLLFETSRGCWWGAKSHCTFCGLNGGTMAFRSKSARRALEELEYLVQRWRIENVEAVDNILDMKYFRDVLPALAGWKWPLQLFYEVKSNLSREQVHLLRDAGVRRIQPGIESLNDHILKLMKKGTTALRNIQLLKWCQEYGVTAEWNMLYGFPGETREDYAAMLRLLPAIRFLRPPSGWGPVRLDRFSPYFSGPAEYGMINIRPMNAYRYLYQADDASLMRLAYYFDYDYDPAVDPTGHAAEVIAYVEKWRREPESGTLGAIGRADGSLVLLDTRSDRLLNEVVLSGPDRAAYEYCDELRSAAGLTLHLQKAFPDATIAEERVVAFLDALVDNRLMVGEGGHYLSLAIPVPPLPPAAGNSHQGGM